MKLVHVGLGGFGTSWEVDALPHVTAAERVAIVEPHEPYLAKAQQSLKLSDDQCFTDLDAAIERHRPDIVLLTTPVGTHAPLAIQALEAGCHVLTEKPFAHSVEAAQQVIDTADRVGRQVMVSQNYRFYPAPRVAARLTQSGELGAPSTVHVDFRKWKNDGEYEKTPHYKFPNPLFADMAIHHWDLMRMVLGCEAVEVYAKGVHPEWSKFDDPADGTAVLTFANGQVVSYRGSWLSSGRPTAWGGEWHQEFAGGAISWTSRDVADSSDRVDVTPHGGKRRSEPMERKPLIGRSAGLTHFVECIQRGVEPETSGRRNLGTLAIVDAVLRSASTGRVEQVQQF